MTKELNTREAIVTYAARLAVKKGFRNVRRAEVATAAGVATGTVSYHFEAIEALQDAIVEHAIKNSMVAVVAQALAEQHPLAVAAPQALKQKAARHLISQ